MCWLVGDDLLIRTVGPYGMILMTMCVYFSDFQSFLKGNLSTSIIIIIMELQTDSAFFVAACISVFIHVHTAQVRPLTQ